MARKGYATGAQRVTMPLLLAGLVGTLLVAAIAGCGSAESNEEKEDTLVKVATRRALAKEFADPTVQAHMRHGGRAATACWRSANTQIPKEPCLNYQLHLLKPQTK